MVDSCKWQCHVNRHVFWSSVYSIHLFVCEGLTSKKTWKYGKAVECGHSHALPSPVKQAACLVGLRSDNLCECATRLIL